MNNILEMLEISASKFPEKVAFKDPVTEITYRSLLNESRIVGSCLDIGPTIVFMNKSCKCIVIILGIIQAGGYYSVFDNKLPKSRLEKMANELQSKTIICDRTLLQEAIDIFGYNAKILIADELTNSSENKDKLLKVRNNHLSSNALYCNFTSGSTGIPKGVIISHESVIDFIPTFVKTMSLKNNDIFANQAPLDFDVSIKDIFSTIYLGATCILIPREYFTNPTTLMDHIEDANVYIWAVSALVFLSTMKALDYKIPAIRKIIYSGEPMPKKHLQRLFTKLPSTQFINVYGPTEVTCNCTYHFISKTDLETELDIIGLPFTNKKVFLMDDSSTEITNPEICGEICVSGICLAIGYTNGSTESFGYRKTQQNPIERYYKTGDLGFYSADGLLHFKGRKDFQIKRFGHRIELAEIERTSENNELIERSCAIYQNEKLYLFYEGDEEEKKLNEFLKEKLPSFMIPNYICKKVKLPINKNGKIDRIILKQEILNNKFYDK